MVCAELNGSSSLLICQSTCGVRSLAFLPSKEWMVKAVTSWTSGFKKTLASSAAIAIGIHYDVTVKVFHSTTGVSVLCA